MSRLGSASGEAMPARTSVSSILHRPSLRRSSPSHFSPLLASVAAACCVGAAALRDVVAVLAQTARARPVLVDPDGQVGLLRLELRPQRGQLRLERRTQPLEGPLLAIELLLLHERGRALLGFLGDPRRPGEHTAGA